MTNENKIFWMNKAEKLEKFAMTCKFEDAKKSALKIAENIRKALEEK